jgi:hypothetical protein
VVVLVVVPVHEVSGPSAGVFQVNEALGGDGKYVITAR